MNLSESRYEEIVVRVVPTHYSPTQKSAQRKDSKYEMGAGAPSRAPRSYDALIYTRLDIESLASPNTSYNLAPEHIGGLLFAGMEELTVRWDLYDEYLATLSRRGTKGRDDLIESLFQMSPALETILRGRVAEGRPLRIWWSSDSPELDELPWELLTLQAYSEWGDRFSFARGLPPEQVPPLVPLEGHVKLAVILGEHDLPGGLALAIEALPSNIQVRSMTGPPQEAIRTAVRDGCELMHIITYGMVSLGHEGILDVGFSAGDESEEHPRHDKLADRFSAAEMSALLRSSRIAAFCLTPPTEAYPRSAPSKGGVQPRSLPMTYRAYAQFCSAPHPMPSMVYSIGPLSEKELYEFWRGFYTTLLETYDIERAMGRGRAGRRDEGKRPLPMALSLRQPNGRLFRDVTASNVGYDADPVKLADELRLSQELVSKLTSSGDPNNLPDSVAEFVQHEQARQERIAEQLKPWLQLQENE